MGRTLNFKKRTLRFVDNGRGGGIEIHLNSISGKPMLNGYKMSAYQNYLGGGLLGCINGDCNYPNWKDNDYLLELNKKLREHYAHRTGQDYSQTQKMPLSAY